MKKTIILSFLNSTILHLLLTGFFLLIGSATIIQPAFSAVVKVQSTQKYTVSGYIKDVATGETLIGASIYVPELKVGAVTNAYGYYSLTLPKGQTILRFSYVGYTTKEVIIQLDKNSTLSPSLDAGQQLAEVVITSNRTETGIRATQMGAESIPMQQIKSTPNMLGEADVMKTIQLVAGVQSGSDGSANLHVRGGAPDQNLILLDGTPIYKVDHAMGLFSIFPPEAVKSVVFFKSSFPARFGGRLSSIVDVRTNDGNMKEYHGLFSVGLLSSKVSIEGPII
ncbi:MAG: carboxypeptidase-like regulatory domain-containing protein, partial [Bacteroidaceae bacterium]